MPYVFENDVVIAFNRKECAELINILLDWKRDTLHGHKSQRHERNNGNEPCTTCRLHTNTAATLLELFEAFGIDIDNRSQS